MSKKRDDVQRKRQKPYAFAPVPGEPATKPPVWHDGTSSAGRYSGELRCVLRNETPLLVGWERNQVKDLLPSVLPAELQGIHPEKAVLYPLRLPTGERPVVIPGDSIKGMLRHELGALLGAPMERVEERRYSYRPNVAFPDDAKDRFLEPRLATVRARGELAVDGKPFPYPRVVEVWDELLTRNDQTYLPRTVNRKPVRPQHGDHRYRFGMGAGRLFEEDVYPAPDGGKQNRRPELRTHVRVKPGKRGRIAHEVSAAVVDQYRQTLRHYLDAKAGHFSRRHPGIETSREVDDAIATLRTGVHDAFQEGDVIWVEWNTDTNQVVSFGWHYYYRWAYRDTVRTRGDFRARDSSRTRDHTRELRPELSAAAAEQDLDEDGRPHGLTAVRRLFGYVSDEHDRAELVPRIGKGRYAQLTGRVSINAALEDLSTPRTEEERFLPATLLRELGQPRPSAVEHYLKQPGDPRADQAELRTYGDAVGKEGEPLDQSGELAGRKFYLHRFGAAATDDSEDNRNNKRSTLALEASRPGATFRFTVRFRDLDAAELAAMMLALCPQQFASELPGNYLPGASTRTRTGTPSYLSKLGYARPLGWGSVAITIAELHFLEDFATQPRLRQEDSLAWFRATCPRNQPLPLEPDLVRRWLELHQRDSVEAGDYPTALPRPSNERGGTRARGARGPQSAKREEEQIYTYHTALRSQHARDRRYRRRS